jgi:hypothetical protein
MNLIALAGEYISKHSLNLGTDVIQHLKAFALHAETTLSHAVETVETDATEAVSYVEEKAISLESAVEEMVRHEEGAFSDLLKSQSQTPESTQ